MGQPIIIKDAREHNLRNIDAEITRDKLVLDCSQLSKTSIACGWQVQ